MEHDKPAELGEANFKGFKNALPGARLKLSFLHKWKDPDPRNNASASGSHGLYRVVCVLQKPAHAELPENNFASADAQHGASYIRVLKQENVAQSDDFAIKFSIVVGQDTLECVGSLNREGCLGKIIMHRVSADSFASAERLACDAVARWLSQVSLSLDIPIEMGNVQVTELATGNHQIGFQTPMVEVPALRIGALSHSDELAFYASLYREALNSNSSVYQFLCLFKVIEGTQARRSRLDKDVISRGGTPHRLRERLPVDADSAASWLKQLFPHTAWDPDSTLLIFPGKTLGMRMNTVLQTHLRPLRNRVAHAVLDSGEMALSADLSFERSTVEEWLPLTKCFARYFLNKEFPEFSVSNSTARPALDVLPSVATAPHDSVHESPAISNIRLSTHFEFRRN
jgi:hypothetical protein